VALCWHALHIRMFYLTKVKWGIIDRVFGTYLLDLDQAISQDDIEACL